MACSFKKLHYILNSAQTSGPKSRSLRCAGLEPQLSPVRRRRWEGDRNLGQTGGELTVEELEVFFMVRGGETQVNHHCEAFSCDFKVAPFVLLPMKSIFKEVE